MLVLIPLLLVAQLSLAQQGPYECHDPAMTSWMTNSRGQSPCRVLQDVMRICSPAYLLDWMPSNYMCDNSPGSITAACCCGSPTFALFSACWSCQYNYTMEATSTTFTSFEKNCAAIPDPLTDYDPIIKARIDEIDIPLWARIEPSAGKWDLEGAWRNATPSAPTTAAPIPTSFPTPTDTSGSSSAGLSSGAIIGIIVGSVFGTAVMFILAAIILWRCLGFGRSQRRPVEDVRIGKDMGYLDGEYIYVPRNPEPRFSSQRESLRPLDLNASDVSREPSDYEYDPPRSHLSARSPSYRETWGEPPSPFSLARHASLDGQYRGYHPGATPHRESMDLAHRSSRYDDGYRPSRDLDGYRRSRDGYDNYRPNPPYRASRDQGAPYRPSRDQDPPYRMSRDYDPERDQGRRRPISGHVSHHRPSGSGDFVSRRPISGQYNGPGSHPSSRPVSGHFRQLSDLRMSTERKKEHRVSVRSGLRHGSFDSTRRSGDVGRFVRLEDRDGGRFSRDGWGRRSRDVAHKASLSEGDEDRESAEATGSKTRSNYHHLRQRSQSARVSHDVERVLAPDDEENARPEEPSTPTPHPATTTSSRSNTGLGSGAPTKPARNPLRVTNAQSDSDRGGSRPRRPITREPSLLARARTLINSRPSSSGRSSTNPPTSPAPGSPAAVPPSAWHQRLPKVLLRSRPGSSHSNTNGPRSSTGSDYSDVTSAYHTAQGHGSSVTELAHRTPELGSRTSGLGELGHRTSGQGDSSYRQEVDAGVQIVVESSPDTPADPHASHPPAYIEENSSTTHLLDPALVHNRLSMLSRDTALSAGDSTISVGEIQTWESARRPTGFVGTGRLITDPVPPTDSARTSRDEGTMADDSSTAVSTTELDMDEYDSADGKAMLGALGLSNSSQEASTIQHQ